jgi:ankyrin repeat protein
MLRKSILAGLFLTGLLAAADTRLADAVQRGDTAMVTSLLKQKVDVNAAQGDGMTPLHWAAFRDDLATAHMLIAAGANVKAQTRLAAVTPLFMAARNGSATMIDALIKAGADAAKADETGTTPLMLVAASGSADAIKVLLDHGAQVNAMESAHGQTALVFAAAHNRDAAVKLLIARGANPELATKVLDPGCGSVFNRNECDELDEFGNPIPAKKDSAKETSGKQASGKETASKETASKDTAAKATVDKSAADKVAKESTEKLTPVEADKAKQEKENGQRRRNGAKAIGGMTPLLFAARDGQMDAARALIEAGADINDAGNGEKMTPLVMAIANGHYDMAKYFLDHGADVNKASAVGLTPLYATLDMEWAPYAWLPQPITYREKTTYVELMKALLAHHANPNAQLGAKVWFRSLSGDHSWVDPSGATAFWRAAQATDLTAMHMLIEAGADPKIATKNGSTALMVASGFGWAANFSRNAPDSWKKAVEYCIELGLDVNAKDVKDYTALHGAAFRGDTALAAFLVEKGAKTDITTKDGLSVADMANGPTEHSEQHPETVALLTKMGSPFANNCRSTNCFIVDGKERKKLGE